MPPHPPRWQRALYVAAALALLLPVWAARYVPTGDGPCHVYSAWVLLHLDDPALPHLAQHFELRAEPLPNWLIQALLLGLLQVASPLAAEKLLLSLYVLVFAAAAWFFAGSVDRGRAASAFLLLPFAWHQLVYWGFYNFAFGVPLTLLALGAWWRHRERPTLRFALAMNLLLVAGYFAHLVTTALALLGVGVLWLATLPRAPLRRHARHLLVLAPQLVLPLWFLATRGPAAPSGGGPSLEARLGFLAKLGVLFPHQTPHAARALLVLLLLLALGTVVGRWRRRTRSAAGPGEGAAGDTATAMGTAEADASPGWRGAAEAHAFPLVAVAFTAAYLVAPEGLAGGTVLPLRLALFPLLALVPWLERPAGAAGRGALVAALALGVVWQAVGLARVHRRMEPAMTAYLAGFAPVKPASGILAIVRDREAGLEARAFGHLAAWAAIERGLVDWGNYQAALEYFPLRFRPGLERPDVVAVEAAPGRYPVRRHAGVVDYVHAWRLPADAALRKRLVRHYALLARSGEGELFRRRGAPPER